MTYVEMIRRLEAGEDPLDLSIEKWEDIVKHLNKIHNFSDYNEMLEAGILNCALCERFFCFRCEDCPIETATGQPYCYGTPYVLFRKAQENRNLEAMRKEAIAELEFLKSLKQKA